MTDEEKKTVEDAFDKGLKIVYRDAWIKRWSIVKIPRWNWSMKEYRILVEVADRSLIPYKIPVTKVYLFNGQHFYIEDENSESMNNVTEMRHSFNNLENKVDLKFNGIDDSISNVLKIADSKIDNESFIKATNEIKTLIGELNTSLKVEEAYRAGGDEKILKDIIAFKDTIVKKVDTYEGIIESVKEISEYIKNFDDNQKALRSNDTLIKGRIRCDVLKPLSIETALDSGYTTDTLGNLRHSNSSKNSDLRLSNNKGDRSLLYNWESGNVTVCGNINSFKEISAGYINAKTRIPFITDVNNIQLEKTEGGYNQRLFAPINTPSLPTKDSDYLIEVDAITQFPRGSAGYRLYCFQRAINLSDGTKYERVWHSDCLVESTLEKPDSWGDWKQFY